MTAKINEDGQLISKPKLLFTTLRKVRLDVFRDVVTSDDISRILLYKDQRQADQIQFTNWVYNDSLQLLHKAEKETIKKDMIRFLIIFQLTTKVIGFTRDKRPDP